MVDWCRIAWSGNWLLGQCVSVDIEERQGRVFFPGVAIMCCMTHNVRVFSFLLRRVVKVVLLWLLDHQTLLVLALFPIWVLLCDGCIPPLSRVHITRQGHILWDLCLLSLCNCYQEQKFLWHQSMFVHPLLAVCLVFLADSKVHGPLLCLVGVINSCQCWRWFVRRHSGEFISYLGDSVTQCFV